MIKNYTSSVSVARSISYIEQKLTQNGANKILKEYGPTGRIDCICFSIQIEGRDIHFKLPARVDRCEQTLRNNLSKRARPETLKKIPAQAERTAWKILSDWVEIQMAMIELAQVEVLEVFLPYVYDTVKRQTFFEGIKRTKYKALLT